MQTNNNQKDTARRSAARMTAAPAGVYEVTEATAKLLDCLRACSTYYDMIADAMQRKYADVLSPEEAEAKAQPYLDALNVVADMLHAEISSSVVDALSDVNNTAADAILI